MELLYPQDTSDYYRKGIREMQIDADSLFYVINLLNYQYHVNIRIDVMLEYLSKIEFSKELVSFINNIKKFIDHRKSAAMATQKNEMFLFSLAAKLEAKAKTKTITGTPEELFLTKIKMLVHKISRHLTFIYSGSIRNNKNEEYDFPSFGEMYNIAQNRISEYRRKQDEERKIREEEEKILKEQRKKEREMQQILDANIEQSYLEVDRIVALRKAEDEEILRQMDNEGKRSRMFSRFTRCLGFGCGRGKTMKKRRNATKQHRKKRSKKSRRGD